MVSENSGLPEQLEAQRKVNEDLQRMRASAIPLEEAASLRQDLENANRVRDEARNAARVAEEEAIRGLEASVKAEREACEVLQGQLEDSKGEQCRLRNEARTLETEVRSHNEVCKEREEEMLQLWNSLAEKSTQLRQAQQHFPLPEIVMEDAEERLRELATLAKRMRVTLGSVARILWYQDSTLPWDLDGVLTRLQDGPTRLDWWQFFGAFEGAQQVLASVRSHFLDLDLGELVRSEVPSCSPEMFFEEVREDGKFAAGACKLQSIIERGD